jgi:hypothetical protein
LTLSPADFRVKTEKSRCFLRGLKIRFRFSLHGADQQVEFILSYRKHAHSPLV